MQKPPPENRRHFQPKKTLSYFHTNPKMIQSRYGIPASRCRYNKTPTLAMVEGSLIWDAYFTTGASA